MYKKIGKNWHYIGIVVLFFGALRYFTDYVIFKNNNIWDGLWVCHITSIFSGIIIFSRNKFFISGIIVWIILGPLTALFFNLDACFSLNGFHHIVTVSTLPVILFYFKKIWNPSGFVFGVISFYSYMAITSNLSNETVNLLNGAPLSAGIFLAIISVMIFFQDKFLGYEKL